MNTFPQSQWMARGGGNWSSRVPGYYAAAGSLRPSSCALQKWGEGYGGAGASVDSTFGVGTVPESAFGPSHVFAISVEPLADISVKLASLYFLFFTSSRGN